MGMLRRSKTQNSFICSTRTRWGSAIDLAVTYAGATALEWENMIAAISARELWAKLQLEAGLEFRLKSGRRGRDADLEDAVLASLLAHMPASAASQNSLPTLLFRDERSKSPRITPEKMLVAVLTSQGGFAAMMEDILNTLIGADARRGDTEMRLAFRFGSVEEPIRLTLEEFQEQEQSIRQVLETRFVPPTSKQLWDVWGLLRDIAATNPHGVAPELNPDAFPPPPALSGTGDPDLDSGLKKIHRLVTEFRAWCRRYALQRQGFWVVTEEASASPDTTIGEQQRLQRWRGAVTDHWDTGVVEAVRQIEAAVRAKDLSPEPVIRDLQPMLATLPTQEQWVDQIYTRLLDILRLPTWRKRHELYSVWVGTVLLRAAQKNADQLQFHAKEGTLSFEFGGNRLATYEYQGEQFDIWAELQSDLVGRSAKRKRGIQPDFRVVRVALNQKVNDATHFVLECKHYLVPSVSNFTQAADDYSRSCPNASTFIVNHGSADHALLIPSVPAAAARRIRFIGEATAERERIQPALQESIRNELFMRRLVSPLGLTTSSGPKPTAGISEIAPLNHEPRVVATIALEWDATLEDVDLELEVINSNGRVEHTVKYIDRGGLTSPPFARLVEDVRTGPGRELIEISSLRDYRYRIVVRNYSKVGELSAGNVSCTLEFYGFWTSLMRPASTQKNEWVVATIDASGERPWVRTSTETTAQSGILPLA